jgi:hypothetical protein
MKSNQEIVIKIQTNSTEWNISILEKIRKKNQPIWSSYEKEKQFTSFIRRLKTEIAIAMNWNEQVCFLFLIFD